MEQARQPAITVAPPAVGPEPSSGVIALPTGTGPIHHQPASAACPRCDTPAPFGASFCAHCGTALAATAPIVPFPANPYARPAAHAPYAGYPSGRYAPAPPAGWHTPDAGMTVALPAGPGGTAVLPYAGFWLRFAALLLDVFGLMVIYFVATVILIMVLGAGNGTMDETAQTRMMLSRVLLIVAPWLYYTVGESSRHQATFGKRMIGLRVVDEAGQRISFGRANGRYWSKQLSGLVLGIGYLVCAFTRRKQALHDLISGCYVVSTRR